MPAKWKTRFQLKPGSWVFVPTKETVSSGLEIKQAIEKGWKPPRYYFHLKDGGHVRALQSHIHHTSFLHLDIRDFFGSINRTRVTRCLKSLFGYCDARAMANESTIFHPDEKGRRTILPFGFVQSPIVASMCLYQSALGRCLHRLNQLKDVQVSVYVDDIVVSTDSHELTTEALGQLTEASKKAGFALNTEKQEGPADSITAFNIDLSHLALVIEPERFARFLEDYKGSDSEFQRNGILGYLNSVNAKQANQVALVS
jgi:hypothetical protein